MYPFNNKKGEYDIKKEALLAKTQRKLAHDDIKKQAYANALWSDDKSKNMINPHPIRETFNLKKFTDREMKENMLMSNEDRDIGSDPRRRVATLGDIGNPDDSMSDIDDNDNAPYNKEFDVDMDDFIEKEQSDAYNDLKTILSEPEVASMGFRPLSSNGEFYTKRIKNEVRPIYLGKDARLEYESGRKASDDYIDDIDWVLTHRYITDVLKFRASSNGRVPKEINKRIVFEALKRNLQDKRNETDERIAMSNEDHPIIIQSSNETETDNELAYKEALEILASNPNNKRGLKSIGITPYNKSGSDHLRNNYRFHLKDNKLVLYTDQSDRKPSPAPAVVRDQISWYYTFMSLFERAKKEKIQFDTTGTRIISQKGAFNSKRALSDSAVSEGTYKPPTKRSVETKAPKFQEEIKSKFVFNPSISELKISPIVKPKGQPEQFDQRYIFNRNGDLVYRSNPSKTLTATDWTKLLKIIDWGSTHQYIISEVGESYNRLINMEPSQLTPAQRSIIANFENTLKNSTPMMTSFPPDQMDIDEFASRRGRGLNSSIILTGRGLVGAGMRPQRKEGRSYNLRDIQGSGLASALKFRPLGSKFIRTADLDRNKLKLVYANRTSVCPLRSITPEVTEIVKELVYDNNINRVKYEALSHDDKEVFHEIVKVTHLKYETKEPIKEPREHLQAEFDKLKGQILLGNNNKELVKELKALSVDMFQNGMIDKQALTEISLI